MLRRSHHRLRWASGLATVVALGVVLPGSAVAALPAECAQSGRTVTCTYTTAGEFYLPFPNEVNTADVTAVGASGGSGIQNEPGGAGVTAHGRVSLGGAHWLYVEVGSNGGAGDRAGNGGAAGINGGGSGNGYAGGGGGASDVRTVAGTFAGTTLQSRLLIAGGGGGAGEAGLLGEAGGAGGPGGQSGGAGTSSGAFGGGGGGGPGGTTATANGGAAGTTADRGGADGTAGSDGTLGVGGAGASSTRGHGGGGGGGLYGGGGGGSGASRHESTSGNGGGGGGSSLVPTGGTVGENTEDLSARVTIVYKLSDHTAPTIAITTPAENATYAQGSRVTAAYACQDEQDGTGIKTCRGDVPAGSPLDTGKTGSHQFTVTAVDNAGNQRQKIVQYKVGELRIALSPFSSSCRHPDGDRDRDDFAVMRIHARDAQPVRRIDVRLDSRLIKRTTRTSFRLVINLVELSLGTHHVHITAFSTAGRHADRTLTLRRCRPLRHDAN